MNSLQSAPVDRLRQLLTVFAILGSFAINAISNIRPWGGQNIGAISNTLFANVLITPANYAFAIWGVIYLGLVGFGVYQFLPAHKQHPKLKTISYLLVLACVAQAMWVYLFLTRLFGWSVVAMVAILLSLIGAYLQLGNDRSPSPQDRWLLRVPFSIYLGWISVATVVNVALALYAANWDGWGITPETWTVLMLAVSTGLGIALLYQRRDISFALVLVWAFVAIAVKRANIPTIAVSAIVFSLVLLSLSFWSVSRRRTLERSN